ncbi:hypothetical protein GCM10009547_34900 [Sporichthya brevicatena]|uniref:Uncharacterized protein n=1 Tax=Sporichthya brevicatena TaxID=171442 RepID=A0ABN1H3U4_9ACTN
MDVTAADVDRIPLSNLRVDRGAFVAVWAAAERRLDDEAEPDWHTAGVADVCRWLAQATVRPASGPWFAAPAPATSRPERALPERIDAEWRTAEALACRSATCAEHAERPGWLDGVCAAFRWAWCGEGGPPLSVMADSCTVITPDRG